MVTTTTPAVGSEQATPAQMMHAMFGGAATLVGGADSRMADPAAMRDDARAREAVLSACGVPALTDIYSRSTDAGGNVVPSRFLSVLPRYTVLGGGVHALKRAADGGTASELVGVIVRLAPYRVLYGRAVDSERYAPSCASINLQKGHGDPGRACQGCPQADYINRDTPWCRQKSRLYIVLRDTQELAVVDLTAMSREGLEAFTQWHRHHGVDPASLLVKLTLSAHPRSAATGNNQTSLVSVRPGAFADRGTDEYRQALERVNRTLSVAEAAWLVDIGEGLAGQAEPATIGGASHLGQAPAVAASEPRAALGGAPPMPAHQAMPDYPADDGPPVDWGDAPVDEWGNVDDLPFFVGRPGFRSDLLG